MVSVQGLSLPVAQDRPLPAVQRAYFYVVLLVAIHMIVLGVANLLRVGAEIALGAPSGGFTGLPFVFADFNRQLRFAHAIAARATERRGILRGEDGRGFHRRRGLGRQWFGWRANFRFRG